MKSLRLALGFLTTFRAHRSCETETPDFPAGLRWFPIVGLLLGAMQWSLAHFFARFVPSEILALVLMLFGIAATGGLHLDGLADTADGFGAGSDRDAILRIMKDTRLGVFAVVAVVMAQLSRFVAYRLVLENGHLTPLLLAPVLSRTLAAATCAFFPYAREQGTARNFAAATPLRHGIPAVVLGVLLISAAQLFSPAIWASGVTALFVFYAQIKIRGFTGDTLGFQIELAEIVFLMAGAKAY